MKCFRTLLRGMSHFSSPRRSISTGFRRSGPRLNRESNQPDVVQSVDILFGGSHGGVGSNMKGQAPQISADGITRRRVSRDERVWHSTHLTVGGTIAEQVIEGVVLMDSRAVGAGHYGFRKGVRRCVMASIQGSADLERR